MNIYVAYKFSNVENKQKLRDDVQKVAELLESQGHNTFILGRDLQKWKDFSHSLHHKMFTIMNKIRKSDLVVAYVNSSVFSRGLLFEMLFAKLFGKKVVLIIRSYIKKSMCEKLATRVVKYDNFEDLLSTFKVTVEDK